MSTNAQNTATATTTDTSQAQNRKAPGIAKQRLEYNGIPFIQKDLAVADLKLSTEVENFKNDADPKTGIVPAQRLTGKYERLGTAPIVVWQRKTGVFEVITGRHRFDLAKETGEATIPCHVIQENDGFTVNMAKSLDAECNIRDGQGTLKDFVEYFNSENAKHITKTEAKKRGLLCRTPGKNAWTIARHASPSTVALWLGDKISDAATIAIAKFAPNDDSRQRVGVKFALKGKSVEEIEAILGLFDQKVRNSIRVIQSDFFASDEDYEEFVEKAINLAHTKRKAMEAELFAIEGAVLKHELAEANNIVVGSLTNNQEKLQKLEVGIDELQNFWNLPILRNQIRDEVLAKFPNTSSTMRFRSASLN